MIFEKSTMKSIIKEIAVCKFFQMGFLKTHVSPLPMFTRNKIHIVQTEILENMMAQKLGLLFSEKKNWIRRNDFTI